MKFLMISTPRDIFYALPISTARSMLERSMAAGAQQKKEGRIIEQYAIPGFGRVITIMEAKSPEEMIKADRDLPITSFMNNEVYPLADYEESARILIEGFKASEKATGAK